MQGRAGTDRPGRQPRADARRGGHTRSTATGPSPNVGLDGRSGIGMAIGPQGRQPVPTHATRQTDEPVIGMHHPAVTSRKGQERHQFRVEIGGEDAR